MKYRLSIAVAVICTLQLSGQSSYDLIINSVTLEEKDFIQDGQELHERIDITYSIVFRKVDSGRALGAEYYMIRRNRTIRNSDTIFLESNRDVIRKECKATIDAGVFEALVLSITRQIDNQSADSSLSEGLCQGGKFKDLGFSVWIEHKELRVNIAKLAPFTPSKPWCLDGGVKTVQNPDLDDLLIRALPEEFQGREKLKTTGVNNAQSQPVRTDPPGGR